MDGKFVCLSVYKLNGSRFFTQLILIHKFQCKRKIPQRPQHAQSAKCWLHLAIYSSQHNCKAHCGNLELGSIQYIYEIMFYLLKCYSARLINLDRSQLTCITVTLLFIFTKQTMLINLIKSLHTFI